MSKNEETSNRKAPLTSSRSLQQLGLCLAGIGSIIISTVVTRRAVLKQRAAGRMKLFQQSNRAYTGSKADGAVVAVEALQIATINTASWALMAFGGLSWALDVSSLDELKRYTRTHTRGDPDLTDQEVEEKFQQDLLELMSKYMSESQVESLLQKAVDGKRVGTKSEDSSGTDTSGKGSL